MTESPLVSIAIPCYNHERYVQECIQSVIDQDYKNIELIIIDDGSSDKSVEKINEMVPVCENRFVRFEFRNRPNKGLSATLNEAIQWCEGRYFSAIASDDVLLPQKTAVLLQNIEGKIGLAGVFSGCHIIDVDGNRIDAVKPQSGIFSFKEIVLRKQNIYAPTQLLNTECVKNVGGYREDLFIEDLYMWLSLTEHGNKLMVVDDLLVEYRKHGENSSNNPLKMYEERIKLLSYFSHSPFYSESLAVNSLAAAYFLTASSKVTAIKLLFKSVGQYPKIVFYPWFTSCCIRLVTPRFIVVQAKRMRDVMSRVSKS